MASEWPIVTVESIAEKVASGPFGSNLRGSEYVESGVRVIRGKNLAGPRFTDEDYVHITDAKAESLSSSLAYPLDIVFAARGSVGAVGLVPQGQHDRYLLSSNLVKVAVDTEKADPRFVFYYFRSWRGQHEILAHVNTTGVPKIERALESLRSFRIPRPPLHAQQAIACILGALDDKIELNRRMNETLDGMARAIFRSWFVDFDPVRAKLALSADGMAAAEGAPGRQSRGLAPHIADLFPDAFEESELGEIPKGWQIKSLDGIAHYQNGLALQKHPPEDDEYLPVIKIRELRQGRPDDKSGKASPDIKSSCVIEDGDVVFSWSGSLLVDLWCGGRGALNQHLFKVTSERYPKWFYYYWTKHHLGEFRRIAAGKATTMGHIKRGHLNSALTHVPPDELLQAADKAIGPVIDRIIVKSLESRTLAELRDTLLPKLISGELRVPDAERIVKRCV